MGGSLRRRKLCARQKGGAKVGKTNRGKGSKWMVVVDGSGVPLGGGIESATPAEVTLLEDVLDTIRVPRAGGGRPKKKPKRLIADKAYFSAPLRDRLAEKGIELIVPPKKNRKPVTKDGRKLRRYRKRWKVERTFAWLGSFRRLVVRYDRSVTIYSAFFHLAIIILVLRRL